MNSSTAAIIRQALDASLVGSLPLELRCKVEEDVPVLCNKRSFDQFHAACKDAGQDVTSTTAKGDPSFPPKSGSPFLKLPVEVRRMIFTRYLLPEKTKNIEPTRYLQRREAYFRKRSGRELATARARVLAQNAVQINFQGVAHWNAQLQQPVPPLLHQAPAPGPVPPPGISLAPHNSNHPQVPSVAAQQALQPLTPQPAALSQSFHFQQSMASAPALNGPPLTANALHGWTTSPQSQSLQHMNIAGSGPPPNLAGMNLGSSSTAPVNQMTTWIAPNHGAQPAPAGLHNFVAMPGGVIVHQLPTQQQYLPLPQSQAVLYDSHKQADDIQRAIAETRRVDLYDTTPENLVTNILTTSVQLCLEVSTILYEEYTFEIHIHSNGIEFLHFDRIPTLETWGLDIEKTMSAFETQGHFCFHRMKHLEFVFFGGDPRDRLAGLRMRESTRKLVSFLQTEKTPLMSLNLRFEYEQSNEDNDWGLPNAVTDDFGTFWSTTPKQTGIGQNVRVWRDPRLSILHDVFNVQLVCAPLKALRKVSKVNLQFPMELKGNRNLRAYGSALEIMMKRSELTEEDQDELIREEMIMDARRDKELKLAGAGGYYKQPQQMVSNGQVTGDFLDATELLMDEYELEEDGLVLPFEPNDGHEGAAYRYADSYDMEMDSDLEVLIDSDLQLSGMDFDDADQHGGDVAEKENRDGEMRKKPTQGLSSHSLSLQLPPSRDQPNVEAQ